MAECFDQRNMPGRAIAIFATAQMKAVRAAIDSTVGKISVSGRVVLGAGISGHDPLQKSARTNFERAEPSIGENW